MSTIIRRSISEYSKFSKFSFRPFGTHFASIHRPLGNKNHYNLIQSEKMLHPNSRGLVTISNSIKESLLKHEIIPTVIHEESFLPKGLLIISYGKDKEVALGNTLKVEETQSCPEIAVTISTDFDEVAISNEDNFTLVVTDPDAPTKGDEKWSEYCHYIRKNIKLNSTTDKTKNIEDQLTTSSILKTGEDLVPYMGPGPPPKTGKHRYCFLLFRQPKGVDPTGIEDRPCWGTNVPGSGVAEWSKKHGLELMAVNFFYAQDKDN